MKRVFLGGAILTLLATAASAVPGDPLTLRNNDAGMRPQVSKSTGTQVVITSSKDKDIATSSGPAPDGPWLKRNNDARGPTATVIHGPAPTGTGALKPIQP